MLLIPPLFIPTSPSRFSIASTKQTQSQNHSTKIERYRVQMISKTLTMNLALLAAALLAAAAAAARNPDPSSGGFFGPGGRFNIPGLGGSDGWPGNLGGGYGSGYGGPTGGHSHNGVVQPSVVCSEKGPCHKKRLICPAKCFSSYSGSGKGYGGGGGGGGCTMDCKKKCVAYC